MAGKTYKTSDPEVIKRWATARAGQPAIMPSQEKEAAAAAVPCIIFPVNDYPGTYSTISWKELFDRMQQDDLVFVYQEKTVSGSTSRFCRFVSHEVAREVETGPETRQQPLSEATGLYQTEALDTPQARGTQAFHYPRHSTSGSRRLLLGLAVCVVLALLLIIGVFWPAA